MDNALETPTYSDVQPSLLNDSSEAQSVFELEDEQRHPWDCDCRVCQAILADAFANGIHPFPRWVLEIDGNRGLLDLWDQLGLQ